MNFFEFLCEIDRKCCGLRSTERDGKASRSELRRWLKMGAVEVDGVRVTADMEVQGNIENLILFPKGKRRCTMGPFYFFEEKTIMVRPA